tara:strand:+ start:446 stop:700 length:255 start_codon:yes stop_codon:yes gene_type:complete
LFEPGGELENETLAVNSDTWYSTIGDEILWSNWTDGNTLGKHSVPLGWAVLSNFTTTKNQGESHSVSARLLEDERTLTMKRRRK